ncbi:MAG: hypothetical protein GY866_39790 [Proteobacteria bacterium]|nr:hypothetical protein [Pseudomonadota bacterium]
MKRFNSLGLFEKTITFFAIVALAFVIAACKEDDDDVADSPGTTELEGTWTALCLVNPDTEAGDKSYIKSYRFSGSNTFTQIETFYLDEACSVHSHGPGSIEGSFSIGESVTTTDGKNAKQLDLSIIWEGDTIPLKTLYILNGNTLTVQCVAGHNECGGTAYPMEMGNGFAMTKQ